MNLIDLHHHSIYSDGRLTVQELLEAASAAGITTISITDHDTFRGQEEASQYARSVGIRYIHGIEISTEFEGIIIHLLGYLPENSTKDLQVKLENYMLKLLVKRMRTKGEERRSRSYIPLIEAIDFVRKERGMAVLAHPILYRNQLRQLLPLVDGIEAIYPAHNKPFISELVKEARNYNLFITAGSDMHGVLRSNEFDQMLLKYGNLTEPFLEKLLDR